MGAKHCEMVQRGLRSDCIRVAPGGEPVGRHDTSRTALAPDPSRSNYLWLSRYRKGIEPQFNGGNIKPLYKRFIQRQKWTKSSRQFTSGRRRAGEQA